MKKNILHLLVLALLTAYGIWIFRQPGLFNFVQPSQATASRFTNLSKEVLLFVGAALFAILMLGSRQNKAGFEQFSARTWLYGIGCILGITTISVLIFNPIGAFYSWNIDNVVQRNPRLVKSYLYNRLKSVPDIVFLGTSVSYRIPAQKYARGFSLSGFNYSVSGGSSIDYFTITNLILSRSTPDQRPAVLVTEILSPSLAPSYNGIEYYTQFPFEAARYMPANFAYQDISRHLEQLFTFSSFPQIMYVEYFTLTKQWVKVPTANTDGAGRVVNPIQQDAAYRRGVTYIGKDLNLLLRCKGLDPQGQDLILQMATMSQKQHVSLVFYRSPINDDFYAILGKDPKLYQPCENRFNQFMERLQAENPYVFFVDLSHYQPISSGGKALYLDSHHLNSAGSNLVLQVLKPTIQKAIDYARSH